MSISGTAAGVFLLQLMVALALPAQAAKVTYKQYKANIKGSTIVLDVGGVHFFGNHPFDPFVTTPADCQTWCDRTPGCTGWTLCTLKGGCASGCKAYAKANPTPAGGVPLAEDNKPYLGNFKGPVSPAIKLPIKYFGGLTGGRGCNEDKWPYGLCSLKSVATPTKPQFFSRKPEEGWVSGVVVLPPSCKGISGVACSTCLASKDPKGCIACAKAASKYAQMGNVADNSFNPTWTEGCAKCTTLTGKARARCYKCLTTGSVCGQCAVTSYTKDNPKAYFNLDSCITCTQGSPKTYEECNSCSQLKAAGVRTKCYQCIKKMGATLNVLPRGIKRRIQTGSFCSSCAQAGPLTDRCIQCGQRFPYNQDCIDCVGRDVPAGQRGKCLDCVAKTKLGQDADETISAGGNGKCSQCLGGGFEGVPKAQKKQCLACLYDPKVLYRGKYWCNSCLIRYPDAARRNKCLACLKKKVKLYSEC